MILNQLSKRERLLFFITVSVLFLAGLINFIILPLGNKWRRLNTQILASSTKYNRYTKILSQERDIEARYKIYADYLKVKGSNEEAQASVLQEIERLSRLAGVAVTNIIPSNLERKDFYNRFEVRMDIEGNILSLIRFLYELQKSKQLFRITRLNITTKSTGSDLLRCSLQLSKIFIP